jgi:hypothetical protein
MNQEITVNDKVLLIRDEQCSLTAEKMPGNVLGITIVSDIEPGFFALSDDAAMILSIFVKPKHL